MLKRWKEVELIDEYLNQKDSVQRTFRRWKGGIALLLAGILLCVVYTNVVPYRRSQGTLGIGDFLDGDIIGPAILLSVIGAIIRIVLRWIENHKTQKLSVLTDVLFQIRDEWFPGKSIGVHFDNRKANHVTKEYWRGSSLSRKLKVKFLDPWMTVKSTFADGSIVVIRFRDKLKYKSGSCINHKRHLMVVLLPNPQLYTEGYLADLAQWKQAVHMKMKERYAPLECLCARRSNGTGVSVTVIQNKSTFSSRDVQCILQVLYEGLAPHLKDPALQSER
jgi:hypothetical protein